jgi:uncharacterized protein
VSGRVTDGRISALAQLVLGTLAKTPGLELKNDHLVLTEIKGALISYLRVDDALDERVRKKIASLSRRVTEGTAEWNVLYRQYLEEEKRKLGR